MANALSYIGKYMYKSIIYYIQETVPDALNFYIWINAKYVSDDLFDAINVCRWYSFSILLIYSIIECK